MNEHVAALRHRELLRVAHRGRKLIGVAAAVEAVAPHQTRHGHRRKNAGDGHDDNEFDEGEAVDRTRAHGIGQELSSPWSSPH